MAILKTKKAFGWKKKILLPVVIAVVAILVMSGIAFAGYNFWSANAAVAVEEAMRVRVDGVWQDTGTYTWSASMFPGASVSKDFIVRNDGSADLGIIPTVSPISRNAGKITTQWNPSAKTTVSPGAANQQTFTLTITAAGDATPGTYSFDIWFERENP